MIQIKPFFAYNDLRNFSYLLYEDNTGEAWAIDPYEAAPLIKCIKENSLTLQGILNTHQHFDHIRGNASLEQAFHVQVKSLGNKGQIRLSEDNELEILDTPGHTFDHQVFVLKEGERARALFSGDTLFNSGVGNCKNGGNVDQLYETTQALLRSLPDETFLYPGHDYAGKNLEFALSLEPENRDIQEQLKETRSTEITQRGPMRLGEEKLVNPFLRLSVDEIKEHFAKEIKGLDDKMDIERELFRKIRSLRDQW